MASTLSAKVSELLEPMITTQSRRQFMRHTLVVLGAVCGACAKREETAGVATPAPTPSTNSAAKWPDNVAGRFFVTGDCIDCELCKETAPTNFKRNEKDGYCYVYKQPASLQELKLCMEAAEGCPVEAIVDSQRPVRERAK